MVNVKYDEYHTLAQEHHTKRITQDDFNNDNLKNLNHGWRESIYRLICLSDIFILITKNLQNIRSRPKRIHR